MQAIPNYPTYCITKKGKVFAYRTRNGRPSDTPREIKPKSVGHGRVQVTLYDGEGNRARFKISRLVAQAFIPNPHNYPLVMHKDNNPLNNNHKNLEWGTQSQNMKQCFKDGRGHGFITNRYSRSGEDNPRSKFTNKQRREIKERYSKELGNSKALAIEYGTSPGNIRKVAKNYVSIQDS